MAHWCGEGEGMGNQTRPFRRSRWCALAARGGRPPTERIPCVDTVLSRLLNRHTTKNLRAPLRQHATHPQRAPIPYAAG